MKLSAATLQQRAADLGALVPLARWHPAVLAWSARRRSGQRWAVALSGGVDSVALLLLLWAHFPARREQLLVLHFNHRLRGRAADADEKFCRELCRRLGVTFEVGRRAVSAKVRNEADARDLRFAFILAAMRRHGAKALWLGHQLNDVAESMLMRLARGSGAGGLSAPRPVRTMPGRLVYLRPLLAMRRSEIESMMQAAGLLWREDASNQSKDFFRNRIRLDVLPAWSEAAKRDALAGAAWSRELLAEDDEALTQWANRLWQKMPRGKLDLSSLAEAPRAVLRRILHRWLWQYAHAPELSRQAFELLLQAVGQGQATRQSLGVKGFARIHGGILSFERTAAK